MQACVDRLEQALAPAQAALSGCTQQQVPLRCRSQCVEAPQHAGRATSGGLPVQPLEQALLHLELARAALVLGSIALCAQGAPDQAASLKQEQVRRQWGWRSSCWTGPTSTSLRPLGQARLQLYEAKVQQAATAAWLAANKPKTQMNVGAANRFISHALPDLSQEQRAALKQVPPVRVRKAPCAAGRQLLRVLAAHLGPTQATSAVMAGKPLPAEAQPKTHRAGLEAGVAADALLSDLDAPSQQQRR